MRISKEEVISQLRCVWGDRFIYESLQYNGSANPLYIQCSCGTLCKSVKYNLLQGFDPCSTCRKKSSLRIERKIKRAKEVENEIKNIHGNVYYMESYESYENIDTLISFQCVYHGSFKKRPYHMITRKDKCQMCHKEDKAKQWIEKCKTNKNCRDWYVYDETTVESFVNRRSGEDPILVWCDVHKEYFKTNQYHHKVGGHGCSKCGSRRNGIALEDLSDKELSEDTILYHIRIFCGGESFEKIGITTIGIDKRLRKLKRSNKLDYEVINESTYPYWLARTLENKIIKDLDSIGKTYKIRVLKEEGIEGWTECFPAHSLDHGSYFF